MLTIDEPPSTDTTSPVMYADSSLSRNATTDAISSVVPARRSGAVAARRTMSARPAAENRSVGTIPGATAFTRIPSGPPYMAAPRSSPSTACLEVWYAIRSALPRRLAIEAVSTTLPAVRCSRYRRNAPRSPRKTPRTLTAMTRSKSAGSSSGNPPGGPGIPALR